MSSLEMLIYTAFDGIQAAITWRNEREYQAVRNFLKKSGAKICDVTSNMPAAREFVYVENKDQIQGLGEFVKTLRLEDT